MLKRRLESCLILGLALTLAACAGNGTRERLDAKGNIADTLDEAARSQPSAPPPAVADALLPRADTLPAVSEQRFDVAVDQADARSFFMGLVKGTPYNMVVHPEVSGRISLNLKNASIPEVMHVVRDVYGYDFRHSDGSFIVLPATLQTRIFQVDYLNLIRSGNSHMRVSSGQATQTPLQTQQFAGAFGVPFGGAAGDGQQQQGLASSRIETESESDFWAELETTLKALVGGGENRNVVINNEAGVVVVRAMPNELRSVGDYLATIQGNVQRQVVIEAKIVEVELADGFQAGINWTALSQSGSRTVTGGMIGGTNLFEDGFSDLRGAPLTIQPGNPITGFGSSAFGGVFALAVNTDDFNAFIEVLETQGDTHVLSSPRTTALNNQKAVIKVGSDEFFVTGLSSNTIAGTATNTNQNIQLTPFFSGIALDVTPQISANGEVLLHIHPSISEVTDQTKEIVFGGQTQRIPLAFTTVRESDTMVRALSGQIVVIGGLMKTSTREQEAKVPFLGDVPLLGKLFTHTRSVQTKSELVILLKPIVVDGDGVWRDMIREPQSRLFGTDGKGGGR